MMGDARRACPRIEETVMRRLFVALALLGSHLRRLRGRVRIRSADAARIERRSCRRHRPTRAGAASMPAGRSATAAPTSNFSGATRATGRLLLRDARARERAARVAVAGARRQGHRRIELRRLRRLQQPVGRRHPRHRRPLQQVVVLGERAGLDRSAARHRPRAATSTTSPSTATASMQHHRLRLGAGARRLDHGNFLPYATAGIAVGRADVSALGARSSARRIRPIRPRPAQPTRPPICVPFSYSQAEAKNDAFIYGWTAGVRHGLC